MIRKITLVLAAVLAAACLSFNYARRSMDPAEVIRKLSGIRAAAAFFRLAKSRPPADIQELVRNGNLEAVPEIKLKWHRTSSKVRNAPTPEPLDTGGWGYVSDPGSADFGTVFIDCVHPDGKGRYWSWF